MSRRAELVATSRADDLSLSSLADLVAITKGDDTRVVGGQMTDLLLAAYPVSGVASRRTRDADTAVSAALARSGLLHERLLTASYTATSGNNYVRELDGGGEMSIDILVPSRTARFHRIILGGRGFDAAPGLQLALSTEPIEIAVGATLLDGRVLEFLARVPPVEAAVVLKAYAYASRREPRDLEDLHRLLEIAAAYPESEIGGWRLRERGLTGSRGDAAAILVRLAHRELRTTVADVPTPRLAALIASLVATA